MADAREPVRGDPLGLAGATCIVTGATSAVGHACARRLAEEGAELVLVGGHAERLQETASSVGATPVVGDPAAEDTAEQAVATAMIRTGTLQVLVHCDLLQKRITLGDTDLDEWDSLVGVNLRGAFAFSRVALRAMTPGRRGAIVLVTSLAGALPALPGAGAIAATTAGVHGLIRALAREGGPHGIRANAVATGYIDTPWSAGWSDDERAIAVRTTPLGRAGAPEEVASAVVWLASAASAFVTGSLLAVDGGLAA